MLYPFTRQDQDNDCGYACLAMLISYHQQLDLSVSEIKHANHLQVGSGAISVAQLCQLAGYYKIDLQAYEVDWNHFVKLTIKRPLIAFCENEAGLSHFVVIYEKTKTKILIGDPAMHHMRWIDLKTWRQSYRNICMFSKKMEQFKIKQQSFLTMLYFLKDKRLWVFSLVILALLTNALLVMNKTFIKIYLDQVAKAIDNQMLVIVLGFVFLMALKAVCDLGFKLVANRLQLRVSKQCHLLFLKNMNSIDLSLYEQFDNSDWIKRLEDINLLVSFVSFNLFNLFLQATLMLVASVLILTSNVLIFILILIDNLITFVLSFVFMKISRLVYNRWFDQTLLYQQKILQYFSSFSQRRARGLDQYFYLDLVLNSDEFYKLTNGWQRIGFLLNFWQSILSQLMNLLIFYFAYFYILKGTMQVGDLLFYTSLMVYFSGFTSAVNDLLINRHQRDRAFQRCGFVLFEIKNEVNRVVMDYAKPISQIAVKNLSYKLGHFKLYQRFDLTLKGWTYLKGASGSGKTTLLQIIAQMRSNYYGEILFDGCDAKTWSETLLRQKLIFIQQNEYLFTASVIDNLMNFGVYHGNNLLSDCDVQSILRTAQIDLSKMSQNNGENMSKGQRQIVVFLAMLFQEHDVYLIDEALSNVDYHVKMLLMALLKRIARNKVVIYCGHDLQLESYFEESQIVDLEQKRLELVYAQG